MGEAGDGVDAFGCGGGFGVAIAKCLDIAVECVDVFIRACEGELEASFEQLIDGGLELLSAGGVVHGAANGAGGEIDDGLIAFASGFASGIDFRGDRCDAEATNFCEGLSGFVVRELGGISRCGGAVF